MSINSKRSLRRIIEQQAAALRLQNAANRLQPIDRDELKAVIMSCGENPAPALVADAVVAHLTAVEA